MSRDVCLSDYSPKLTWDSRHSRKTGHAGLLGMANSILYDTQATSAYKRHLGRYIPSIERTPDRPAGYIYQRLLYVSHGCVTILGSPF